ncbi:hepatitis A virus cellular receptor 2-like isoform X2 [Antennarius striatus]|uniref:hepatitis A virus cellular receptor 2-like isoform X2 n=1 Tax=Antennarius striatus TaxID=241820 RepID=UPI0035AFC8E6
MMRILLLLTLLTVSECTSSTVVGQTGRVIVLPCMYDVASYGRLSVCWGRGQIPGSGCSDQLISTDGTTSTDAVSSRYRLAGRLEDGDVSLTILNARESDAGVYGCRVEIPGWFNDHKHHFELVIEAGQLTSTEMLQTSSFDGVKVAAGSGLSVVLFSGLVGTVTMVAVGGLLIFIIIKRRRRDKNPPHQEVSSLVFYQSSSSALGLHGRAPAVENIYQMDADDDDGDSFGGYYGNLNGGGHAGSYSGSCGSYNGGGDAGCYGGSYGNFNGGGGRGSVGGHCPC